MKKRIEAIDGWRTIAAVGVLYGHILGTLNNPSCKILGVDILKLLGLWGKGVHLFFVISGFCFFLVLDKKNDLSVQSAIQFWKKRWLRIAPAFYTACLVYGVMYFESFKSNWFWAFVANFCFVQPYFVNTEISAHFWSLSVEWLFYLSLPFIFYLISKLSYLKVVAIVIISGILLNLIHFTGFVYKNDFSWYYTYFANFEHFGWGILLGYIYTKRDDIGVYFKNPLWFFVGLILAYAGKTFFYTGFLDKVKSVSFIFESIGPLVMTLGFAVMILSSLNNMFFNKLIGNRLFVFIGKISYSFYLWHVLILFYVHKFLFNIISSNAMGVVVVFVVSMIVLIPVSWLSYKLFEEFYFKRRVNQ